MSSVETLEMFRKGYQDEDEDSDSKSECSAVLALQDTVQELDDIFDDFHEGNSYGVEDDEDDFSQELSSLKRSLHLLQTELNAVDMIIPHLGSSKESNIEDRDINDTDTDTDTDTAGENIISTPLHQKLASESLPPPPTAGAHMSHMCDVTDCYAEICNHRTTTVSNVETHENGSSRLPQDSGRSSPDGSMAFSPFSPFSYDDLSVPMDDGFFFCPGPCTPKRLSLESYFWEDDNERTPPLSPITNSSSCSEKYSINYLSMITELDVDPMSGDTKTPTSRQSAVSSGTCTVDHNSSEDDDSTDIEYSDSLLMKSMKTGMKQWSSPTSPPKQSWTNKQARIPRSPIQRKPHKAIEIDMSSAHKRPQQRTLRRSPAPNDSSDLYLTNDQPLNRRESIAKPVTIGNKRQDEAKRARNTDKPIPRILSVSSDDSSTVYLQDAGSPKGVPPLSPRDRKPTNEPDFRSRMLRQGKRRQDRNYVAPKFMTPRIELAQVTSPGRNSIPKDTTNNSPQNKNVCKEKEPMHQKEEPRIHLSVASPRSSTVLYSFESEKHSDIGNHQTAPSTRNQANNYSNSMVDKYKSLASPQSSHTTNQHSEIRNGVSRTNDASDFMADKYKPLVSPQSSRNTTPHCKTRNGVSRGNHDSNFMADKYESLALSQSSHTTHRHSETRNGVSRLRRENTVKSPKEAECGGGSPGSTRSFLQLPILNEKECSKEQTEKIMGRKRSSKKMGAIQVELKVTTAGSIREAPQTASGLHNPNARKFTFEKDKQNKSRRNSTRVRCEEINTVPSDERDCAAARSENRIQELEVDNHIKVSNRKSRCSPSCSSKDIPEYRDAIILTSQRAPVSPLSHCPSQNLSTIPNGDTKKQSRRFDDPKSPQDAPFDEKRYEGDRTFSVAIFEGVENCIELICGDIPTSALGFVRDAQRGASQHDAEATNAPQGEMNEDRVNGTDTIRNSHNYSVLQEEKQEMDKAINFETEEIASPTGNLTFEAKGTSKSRSVSKAVVSSAAVSQKDSLRLLRSRDNPCEEPRGVQSKAPNVAEDAVHSAKTEKHHIKKKSGNKEEEKEILMRNGLLLDAIVHFDHDGYRSLTHESLLGIDLQGKVLDGNDIPGYHLEGTHLMNVSMVSPSVRFLSKWAAVVSYIRIDQVVRGRRSQTIEGRETRVWEKQDGNWINCHYHQTIVARNRPTPASSGQQRETTHENIELATHSHSR
jgi:hypothetical protein